MGVTPDLRARTLLKGKIVDPRKLPVLVTPDLRARTLLKVDSVLQVGDRTQVLLRTFGPGPY